MKVTSEKRWTLSRWIAVVFTIGIVGVVLLASPGFAAGAFDSLTEQSIIQKIGNVIKLIAGIAGVIVLAMGLLIGGIGSLRGSEDAQRWIKGGIFGGFLCFSCWALANLFISVMR